MLEQIAWPLAVVGGALIALVSAFFAFGRVKKRLGEKGVEAESAKKTITKTEDAQRAVADRRAQWLRLRERLRKRSSPEN